MRPFRFADGTLWSCEAGEAGERVSGRRAAQTRLETQSGTVAGEKAGVCPKTAQRPKKVTRLAVRRAGSPWEGDIWMQRLGGRKRLEVSRFF